MNLPGVEDVISDMCCYKLLASLLDVDGMSSVEGEDGENLTIAGRFDKAVAHAIFVYGEAPSTEFGKDDALPQPPMRRKRSPCRALVPITKSAEFATSR